MDHGVWLVNILFIYFGPICLELMPTPHTPGIPILGALWTPCPSHRVFQAGSCLHCLPCCLCTQCYHDSGSSFGVPCGLGQGARLRYVRALPNHVPDPGYKGRHLRVHIGGLGVAAPEAREGHNAMGPVPAHQRPPGVCLGVDGKARSAVPLSASLSVKELLYVNTMAPSCSKAKTNTGLQPFMHGSLLMVSLPGKPSLRA